MANRKDSWKISDNGVMANQPRMAKVLLSLVVSMTVGAVLLMALDKQPLAAGAFSLASYSRLNSIEDAVDNMVAYNSSRWNRIEIYFSNTQGGNIEQIASLNGLTSPSDVNFHFLVCNGLGGIDGYLQPTEKWHQQWSCVPGGTWYGSGQTIRICLVSEGKITGITDSQSKRVAALVECLCRKFNINLNDVVYPLEPRP